MLNRIYQASDAAPGRLLQRHRSTPVRGVPVYVSLGTGARLLPCTQAHCGARACQLSLLSPAPMHCGACACLLRGLPAECSACQVLRSACPECIALSPPPRSQVMLPLGAPWLLDMHAAQPTNQQMHHPPPRPHAGHAALGHGLAAGAGGPGQARADPGGGHGGRAGDAAGGGGGGGDGGRVVGDRGARGAWVLRLQRLPPAV